jgi:predicted GNAT family N-acyltransferase
VYVGVSDLREIEHVFTFKIATTASELEECFRIRELVFIVEQNVPIDIERDEYDATAIHFLAFDNDEAIGTARVVLKDNGHTAKIGRVAVLPSRRGEGIGKGLIMEIEKSSVLRDVNDFRLDAQVQALSFYERLGYEAYGKEFSDADIMLRSMLKPVKRPLVG